MCSRYFTLMILVFIGFTDCHRAFSNDRAPFPDPYFLPGDAFFHTVITEKVLKDLEKEPDYIFEYDRPYWQYTIPGYYSLSLGKQNRNLEKQIKEAYYCLRQNMRLLQLKVRGRSPNSILDKTSEVKTELVEINGPRLFFYNEDYDWKKRHITLKYNENWYHELKSFGYKNASYGAFVKTPEAIIDSWRFSSVVPPLSVQLPKTPIIKHRAIKKPMIAKGRLKAIMLPDSEYIKYYKMDQDKELIVITNEKIQPYYISDGEWHEIDF